MREYLDFRVEITAFDDTAWAVQASCPVGETRSTTAVSVDRRRIDKLVAELDGRRISAGACFELGTLLGGILLPGEVLDLFRAAFPGESDATAGIRLRLVVRETWAASLPWEFAHVPLRADDDALVPYLALHPAVSIMRHEAMPSPQPVLEGTDGAALSVLSASARQLPGLPALAAADLGSQGPAGNTRLRVERLPDPVTAAALESALCTSYDVFHFAGHSMHRSRLDGSDMVGLAIADDGGREALLSGEKLAVLLKAAKVKIAVINTCNPTEGLGAHRLGLGTLLVEAGVPAVVVMQLPVEDAHAAAFSRAFYTALAAGASLDEAVSDGRRRISASGILPDWGAPVVFCRSIHNTFFTRAAAPAADATDHTASYRAGHGGPRPAGDSTRIWQALHQLCEEWEPSDSLDERTEITRVTALREAAASEPGASAAALIRVLAEAYPSAIGEGELLLRLDVAHRRRLSALVREANQALTARNRDELSRFSITGVKDTEQGYCLRRRPVTDLIERSPAAHAKLDYHLRLAFGLYDVGDYRQSIAHLVDRLESSQRNHGLLTVPEHSLLFYYLSKSLLKLNRYEELLVVLEGPYRNLSQSVLADLEVERLHIAGVRHRQLGELGPAQTCFEAAIATLEPSLRAAREPAVLCGLGDSWVLLAQCRLEQALSPSPPELVRNAALRSAHEALRNGSAQFAELRGVTGVGTHYEGRLNGTAAFATVVSSLVNLQAVTQTMWDKAVESARGGFTPERDRKPFGIVAGKFALSSVLLAQARWHCLARAGSGESRARECVSQAFALLTSLRTDHMDTKRVHLGHQFEIPKIELATRTSEELDSCEKLADVGLWKGIVSREAIWSPLV
ncbi:CHAT domain-containing protein [Streptomyces sp. NBC_01716]|uniref:CHAT domain-containing protein n=1 Tax=Streptomyces sp. NBC_01716 TaxID=2975917 RepID=UPI002E35BB02|nr:CHAT domain-containing protein [Streptomyces sp. NBC_01716]